MNTADPASLSNHIRAEAARIGFIKAGITKVRPLPRSERFTQWLDEGMHGSMDYMRRQHDRRCAPGLLLENAQSLLVLAMNYQSGDSLSEDPALGRISRYAWGADYHRILMERLERLEALIKQASPAARTLSYTDTGPIMEKAWGALSSLGWMGKHTNLITREQGSWFFLGIILLDIELDYDLPEKDYCGTCMRCIAACPTGAIVAPYVLDARLCISYLTIELRGKIPVSLRPLIGNRIFGCDDCQDVCPWNRFASRSQEQGFQPREENLNPALARLVDLSPEEFSRRFRGSPIRRARRDGFVRNVVVALGNSRRPEAVPPLERALFDRSPLVRAHAVWALARIGSTESHDLLARARLSETDPSVLEEYPLAAN